MEDINKLTQKIIGLAINVHKNLGPGFVEKIYQRALYLEFKNNNLLFDREKKISIYYHNALLGYEKVDFIIENKIILEVKCVGEINEIHKAQLLSYLKAANLKLGLLINFAKPIIEIKRLINSALR
jgi:GxxExxY protein